ncbi:unnamed protein product, partial [Thelazia callipaeda]|uniref:Glycogen [starch] synthase n=1 Tax=Thelazia callipaeda TaxID=103827 RepID=A0A0N5CNR4_THECL
MDISVCLHLPSSHYFLRILNFTLNSPGNRILQALLKIMAQRGHLLRSLSRTKVAKALAGVDMEQTEVVRMDNGKTARREARCVFECSWEVANKVGGIYTVIRSKAAITTEEYGDQYCLLGPLREGKWQLEVEQVAPESLHIAEAIDKLREDGFE